MSLLPSTTEIQARAVSDLRVGLPIVVRLEGALVLIAAIETLAPARLETLRSMGAAQIALSARRAEVLHIPVYDSDLVRIDMPHGADCAWLRALADPADDLRRPLKGPFAAQRGAGAGLARVGIMLCKLAQLLPACLIVPIEDAPAGLTLVDAADPVPQHSLASVAGAALPMALAQHGRLRIFRSDAGAEHYAIEIGQPARSAPVLCRLHSACFTGDVLGSLKCDCGPQLHAALAAMDAEGAGVLLYLNQEGRGIGLANKMRAYDLQDQGFDTVEANHRLGFEDDERDFATGARLLRALGFGQVRLMTNNPRKVDRLNSNGIEVTERVPLRVGRGPLNDAYLRVKAHKSGHLL